MSQETMKVLEMLSDGKISTEEAMKLIEQLQTAEQKTETKEEESSKEVTSEPEAKAETGEEAKEEVKEETQEETSSSQETEEAPEEEANQNSGSESNCNSYEHFFKNVEDAVDGIMDHVSDKLDKVEEVVEGVVEDIFQKDGESNEETEGENAEQKTSREFHFGKDINIDTGWINDLKNNIVESAINISKYVGSQSYNGFGFAKAYTQFSAKAENVSHKIKSIKLAGKNDRIEIMGHDQDTILIEARYKVKGSDEIAIELEEQDGHYNLTYDTNEVYSMGIFVKVPQVQIPSIYTENKNASIVVKKVKAEKLDVITKNATIDLDYVTGIDINAETKNAPIHLFDVFGSKISAKTSNSEISVKETDADFARIITSNAVINCDGIDIREVYAKTSNGGIYIQNMKEIEEDGYPLYNVEAYTSNAHITIAVPYFPHIPCKLNASTTNGTIKGDMTDMEFLVNNKNFVKAKAPNFENSKQKMTLMLQTTNGNINLK